MTLETVQEKKRPVATWRRGATALRLALASILVLAGLALANPQVFAAEAPARFWIGRTYYEAVGRQYPMDVAPYIKDGRSYVPVRYSAYALGMPDAGIRWDGATRTVSVRKGDIALRLKLGSFLLERRVSGKPPVSLVMDVAPEVRFDRVFLPARYVAAGLGYSTAWEPATREVTLTPGGVAWSDKPVSVAEIEENPERFKDALVRIQGYGVIVATIPLCPGYVSIDTRYRFVEKKSQVGIVAKLPEGLNKLYDLALKEGDPHLRRLASRFYGGFSGLEGDEGPWFFWVYVRIFDGEIGCPGDIRKEKFPYMEIVGVE